jgi:hypothetical protein
MARLEDRGRRGLPPPPAPTRRGANPWPLSDTAQQRPAPLPRDPDPELLEGLVVDLPPGFEPELEPEAAERPAPPISGEPRRLRFWPLLALLVLAGIAITVLLNARRSGEWRDALPALFAILFIAHGLWRARSRPGSGDAPKKGEGRSAKG